MPEVPASPHVETVGCGSVLLTWAAPYAKGDPPKKYTLRWRAAAGGTAALSRPSYTTATCPAANATSGCEVGHLNPKTTYAFSVAASNRVGTSAFSPSISVVTAPAPEGPPKPPEPPAVGDAPNCKSVRRLCLALEPARRREDALTLCRKLISERL